MKMLKERQEIAMAINFGKYPVLKIDLADADEYGLAGCHVRIDAGTFRSGHPHIIDAVLRVYTDEKRLTTTRKSSCLHDSFSYYDYIEMTENAMAPLIHQDEDVVITIFNSKSKLALAPMIVHTGHRVDSSCSTPLEFEAVDMTPYLKLAGLCPL